jgi:hypothetical protein
VLDDCLLHLADDEPGIRRVGAETLRDLRHPSARHALAATLGEVDDDDVVAITAHALTMLGDIHAAPVILDRARRAGDGALRQLLERWARQLLDRISHN